MIRSVHNPRIKRAIRLRDRRGRRQQARILVEGMRETCRAIEAGIDPIEVFVCEPLVEQAQRRALFELLHSTGIEPTSIGEDVFNKLAYGNRTDGIILIAAEPQLQLHDIVLPRDGLIGVLERVEKPGNLGAIVRTADAAGVSAMIVADGGTDIYNPNAIRASMGAIFRVPVCATTAADALDWLCEHQATIYVARVDAAIHYAAVDYQGMSAIVLGSESQGLSDLWQGERVTPIALPMLGIVDSLNVSATAAVLFYEAVRQRQT